MPPDESAPLPFLEPAAGERRRFLGRDAALPELAARWLLEALSDEARAATLVALPGRRARAALLAALQARAAAAPSAHWPELLTVGQLGDALARPSADELARDPARAAAARRVASRVERSRVWQQVFAALPDDARRLLLPDAADTPAARRALAASLRRLHASLAAADLDGADLAEGQAPVGPDRERWRLFADVQRRVLAALAARALHDPHDLRRRTRELPARGLPRVVLVGVTDLAPLLEHQLEHRAARVDLLLPGEERTHAARHDAWGRVRPEALQRLAIPGLTSRWTVHDDPDAQADALARALDVDAPETPPAPTGTPLTEADTGADAAPVAVPDAVLCLPDPELHAPVRRRLGERGLALHDAGGRPWSRTPLARWLAAVAAHLEQPSFASFAALLRQPALEAWLAAERGLPAPARHLDRYHEAHLPAGLPRRWRALPSGARGHAASLAARDVLTRAREAVDALLGAFTRDAQRPASELVTALREQLAALSATSAGAELLGGRAARRLDELLRDASRLPDDEPLTPSELLALLEEALADARVDEPPGGPALEALTLAELPFSAARRVLVAGFHEGALPAAVRTHPWLPDGLCAELGLPHAAARHAQQLALLVELAERGVDLRLFSGRRGREGDPRRPSRLAFAGDDAQAMDAARHALRDAEAAPPAPAMDTGRAPAPLMLPEPPVIESLSVTDFDAYLDSPYQCYVERILRRTSSDDAAHELDGGAFGTLAHELLEAFGRSDLAGSTSADDIADWFERELEQLAARRFGPEAAPAVALQLRQLGWRLRNFARWQAAEAARGWRIEHVEWKPPGGGVEVSLDGEVVTLRGRIDRIDVHAESGAWRLIDYKTSDAGDSPRTVHGGRGGVWKKLQLPLYLQLVEDRRRELGRALPELGFLVLPKDDRSRGAWKPADWTPQELAHAVRTAGEIVRRLRAGDVTALGAGTWLADDPSLRALSGLGLVGGPRTARLGALVPEDGAVDAARDDGPAEAAS